MPRTLPDDLTQMPADERLQLIDALWDSLDDGQVPVSEEQLAELNRRRDAIQEQLRRKLADELDRHFTLLSEAPRQFPVAFRDVRRAVVSRFPYSIYFFIEPGTVVVIAVMHNRRDPSLWQSRL